MMIIAIIAFNSTIFMNFHNSCICSALVCSALWRTRSTTFFYWQVRPLLFVESTYCVHLTSRVSHVVMWYEVISTSDGQRYEYVKKWAKLKSPSINRTSKVLNVRVDECRRFVIACANKIHSYCNFDAVKLLIVIS